MSEPRAAVTASIATPQWDVVLSSQRTKWLWAAAALQLVQGWLSAPYAPKHAAAESVFWQCVWLTDTLSLATVQVQKKQG